MLRCDDALLRVGEARTEVNYQGVVDCGDLAYYRLIFFFLLYYNATLRLHLTGQLKKLEINEADKRASLSA